jgi:hypothetical protein
VFRSWNLTYGGGVARDAAMGQLRWSARLLNAICSDELRPELLCAVGDLADTVGYITMDAGADEEGRRVYRFALVTGDPLQAVTIGHEALDTAGSIRSRTTADDLRELARHAAAHQHLDEVAHLRHRIGILLVRADSPSGGWEFSPHQP